MLLMIVMVIMIVSSALMLALFSSFLPFVRNYGNVAQYTTAYYGALSAVERGVLATNYAGPGFDWESGRKSSKQTQTPVGTWKTSDHRLQNFYTYGNGNDTLNWTVNSSTKSIPKVWDGSVDPVFVKPGEQNNYNALTYNTTEMIPLGSITAINPADYYTSSQRHTTFTQDSPVKVEFRLNPVLSGQFKHANSIYWAMNDGYQLCEEAKCWTLFTYVGANNKAMVGWTIKGIYKNTPYTLIPFTSYNTTRWEARLDTDTLIRASRINKDQNLTFGNSAQIFPDNRYAKINPISSREEEINASPNGYTNVLRNGEDSVLQLNLVNLLSTKNDRIYPFLEYRVSSEAPLADRYYTIVWEGQVGDYNLRMQVKKPTYQQPALGSFTIIF